ncbi:Uncharacterised protein [Vibrio cholerae]|nr:Uncharacterised protein [Vibrio cholerae]CSB57034.1 Uncharacterised protein [Vibrio cholerae]CSI63274.1 Uncharacterised protein [Vibrio cholerae]
MCVMGNILIKALHVIPRFIFAHVLQPCGNLHVPRAGRCRVRHRNVAFVDRVSQIFPTLWLR